MRTALGIVPRLHDRTEDRWIIIDVILRSGERPEERWTWLDASANDGRAVWRHKMADDTRRLDFQLAPNEDPAVVTTESAMRERVAKLVGPDVAFDIAWSGAWGYRHECLDDLRRGRVLFVGDAAHLVAPFGARGGNGGIQDADNLGWKLALHLQGLAGEAVLDSYGHERKHAALENIRQCTPVFALRLPGGTQLGRAVARRHHRAGAGPRLGRPHDQHRAPLHTRHLPRVGACSRHACTNRRGASECGALQRRPRRVAAAHDAASDPRPLVHRIGARGRAALAACSASAVALGRRRTALRRAGRAALARQLSRPADAGAVWLIRPDQHVMAVLSIDEVNAMEKLSALLQAALDATPIVCEEA